MHDFKNEKTYYYGDFVVENEDNWIGIIIQKENIGFKFDVDCYDDQVEFKDFNELSKTKAKKEEFWINYSSVKDNLCNKTCALTSIKYCQSYGELLKILVHLKRN